MRNNLSTNEKVEDDEGQFRLDATTEQEADFAAPNRGRCEASNVFKDAFFFQLLYGKLRRRKGSSVVSERK